MKIKLSLLAVIIPYILFAGSYTLKSANLEVVMKTDSLVPGDIVKFTTAGKHQLSYHVYTPTHFDPQTPPPIVISFSSGGLGLELLNSFKDAAEEMGWIGVGCDSLQNNMVVGDTVQWEMEQELLDDILNTVPHNTERIYLNGNSGGGMRCYGITARYDYKIAGVLAHGGWLGGPGYQNEPYREGMDIAMLNGNLDMGATPWTVMDTKTLQKRNCHVKHFTCIGGHVVAPAKVTLIAFKWLEEQWNLRKVPASAKVQLKVLFVGNNEQRTADFISFLKTKFYSASSVPTDSVTLDRCNEADILVMDGPVYTLPDNYNKAMVLIGPSALLTGQRFGSRMKSVTESDWAYALLPDTTTSLFIKPHKLKLKTKLVHLGAAEGKARVWNLSQPNDASVVLLDDAPFQNMPDSEILLSGIAKDGVQGAMILREGSRLFWGDTSVPSQLTKAGRELLFRGILWIANWDGARQTEYSGTTPRDSIMSLIERVDLRAKNALRWFPEDVLSACDYDKQALKAYYRKYMPYIFTDFGSGQLSVDKLALEFGTPNNEPGSILKWIDLFENNGWPIRWNSRHVLGRYANTYLRKNKNWREWYEQNKDKLKFSDEDGYRFILEE